ncbi:hypothetical protein L208DRAFT_1279223, partial [Tricholoma matsutake]
FKIDPEINISCLRPYCPPTIPGQQTTPQPPIIVEGAPEYIVEEILDSCLQQNKLEFLIKWKNYTDKNNLWSLLSCCPHWPIGPLILLSSLPHCPHYLIVSIVSLFPSSHHPHHLVIPVIISIPSSLPLPSVPTIHTSSGS